MATRRSPELAAGTLAALSCVAALSLRRVFGDAAFVAPVLAAAIIPHAAGYGARRWRWAGIITLAVSMLSLVLYAIWVLEPSTTRYGLPTARSLHALGHHLDAGWTVLCTGIAPVPARAGPLVLAVVGTWLVALSADWLAFRLDATIGAVAPSLVLFVMAATLGTNDDRGALTAGFAGAAMAFLLLQHAALLERRRAWFSGRHLGSVSRTLAVGIALGMAAVLAGSLAGPLLPGADGKPLLDYRRFGATNDDGSGVIKVDDPLVDIGSAFLRRAPSELFTVNITPTWGPLVEPAADQYYRFAALDLFDGRVWKLDTDSRTAGSSLAASPPSGSIRQEYTIGALEGRWVPAMYRAFSVSLPDTRVIADVDALLTSAKTIARSRYVVDSIPTTRPAPERAGATASRPPRELAERFTRLPPEFPRVVRDQARQITRGATNRFDRALLLERFFTDPANGFEYDLDVPKGHGNRAMVAFLTNKTGFCEQFAGTFTAMARSLGIPARVAVGFTTGIPDPAASSLFHVGTQHAHAWSEVWLSDELGWVAFEPTPAGFLPGMAPVREQAGPGPDVFTPVDSTTASPSTPSPATPSTRTPPPVSTPAAARGGSSGISTFWLLAIGLPLLALALIGAYTMAVLGWKARRLARRRTSPDTRVVVRGAWTTALERLGDAGVPSHPSMTPLELAARVPKSDSPALARPMHTLAASYTAAAYAAAPPSPDDARDAWETVEELARILEAAETSTHRWRRKLDPRPLLTRR